MVERDHFGRDRPVDDAGNLPDHLEEIAARLVDQRGIGGDAVEQPGLGQVADVGGVGGVGEEFHEHAPSP